MKEKIQRFLLERLEPALYKQRVAADSKTAQRRLDEGRHGSLADLVAQYETGLEEGDEVRQAYAAEMMNTFDEMRRKGKTPNVLEDYKFNTSRDMEEDAIRMEIKKAIVNEAKKGPLQKAVRAAGSDYGTGVIMGSGMTAGAAGLIAIMQALQGAQDNQERRDYPLQ
tara:strand:- start:233 stop:733 length:501 start_codon:yes stop_codon:yes gene_type:complete